MKKPKQFQIKVHGYKSLCKQITYVSDDSNGDSTLTLIHTPALAFTK
jgi:hypothetical protein